MIGHYATWRQQCNLKPHVLKPKLYTVESRALSGKLKHARLLAQHSLDLARSETDYARG